MSSELDGLKKQSSIYRGILTRLSNYASGITERSGETVEEMRVKSNRAKEILDKFMDVEASIFAINCEEESKMADAEDSYYSVVAKLNTWIKKRSISDVSISNNDTILNTSSMHHAPEIRLAKLQIPPFTGDYTEWQSFFDLFHSSIHSRENITPVQKFQYLMGLLKGEAFSLVKHLKVTEANYMEALKKLQQRYDRKRHTINAFIRSFIEQPTVHLATASNIRKLLDISDEVVRGLKALGDQAEARDPWLIYILQEKLNDETRSLWAQQNANIEFPKITEFFDFLIKRTDALESIRAHSIRSTKATTPKPISIRSRNSYATTTNYNCVACSMQQHRLIDCDQFIKLSVEERRNLMATNKRCFNCLNQGHSAYDCRMKGRCRDCSLKHHTLLHIYNTSNTLTTSTEAKNNIVEVDPRVNLHTCSNDIADASLDQQISLKCTLQTILPTALINVFDELGVPRTCRALLDTASQASFVTESLVQKLGIPRQNCRNLISGIGQINSGTSRGVTTLRITSRFNSAQLASFKALIIPKITSTLPAFELDISGIKNLKNISLADPYFFKPGSIDILLGADIVFELFEEKIMKLESSLIAHNTKLGWIIAGKHQTETNNRTNSFATIVDIDARLQRFWEIEEVNQITATSKEEQDCEQWFKSTTQRAHDGRFITKLPFKETSNLIGSTYHQAVSRLLAMERKFKTNDQFRKLYVDFLKEYEQLNHMRPVDISSKELQKLYILPHHGVMKSSSSTTKLRVVFDASAKSTTGVSLNQNLMVGPNIQSSLFHILLRLRQHSHVLVGDIEKMYRQVLVAKEDTKHQIILWRDDKQNIRPYALNTVTYGMASASFMATRCLRELAELNEE